MVRGKRPGRDGTPKFVWQQAEEPAPQQDDGATAPAPMAAPMVAPVPAQAAPMPVAPPAPVPETAAVPKQAPTASAPAPVAWGASMPPAMSAPAGPEPGPSEPRGPFSTHRRAIVTGVTVALVLGCALGVGDLVTQHSTSLAAAQGPSTPEKPATTLSPSAPATTAKPSPSAKPSASPTKASPSPSKVVVIQLPPPPPSPSPSPTPVTVDVSKQLYAADGLKLTLTSIVADPDGQITVNVTYQNTTSSAAGLVCAGDTDPSVDTLTPAKGSAIGATHSYCSDHPTAPLTLAAGGTLNSYAIFVGVDAAAGPFSFTWQSGGSITGTIAGLTLN